MRYYYRIIGWLRVVRDAIALGSWAKAIEARDARTARARRIAARINAMFSDMYDPTNIGFRKSFDFTSE